MTLREVVHELEARLVLTEQRVKTQPRGSIYERHAASYRGAIACLRDVVKEPDTDAGPRGATPRTTAGDAGEET